MKKSRTRKKPGIITRIKRAILFMASGLFLLCLWLAYSEFNGMFSSRVGRAATWGTGAILSPALESLPWWFWGIVGSVAIYLWLKHKLIMSIVYGLAAGIMFAVGG